MPSKRLPPPRAVPPAPPLSSVRRIATAREFGEPVQLVVLFRAPPPVHVVAGKMWINAPTRDVTVIVQPGPHAVKMTAIRRTHAWVGYVDERDVADWTTKRAGFCLMTTGPLDPRERDITWAWGWKSKAAKALRVLEALR